MHGYSSHTFKLVDHHNNFKYVKFHIKTTAGAKNLFRERAGELLSKDPDYATRDLFFAIARGEYPSWDVCIQVMEPKDAESYKWNILDVTKVWPHKDYPLLKIGKIVLNRNPENYFAETEQSAFSPSHLVPGIEPTDDKMLQGRLFSYSDTHRHRLGANYLQIPINKPVHAKISHHQRDGFMSVDGNFGSLPNYEPNSFGGPFQVGPANGVTFLSHPVHGQTTRYVMPLLDLDFVQPGNLFRLQTPEAKARLIGNVVGHLKNAKKFIQARQISHFKKADKDYGQLIEKGILSSTVKV